MLNAFLIYESRIYFGLHFLSSTYSTSYIKSQNFQPHTSFTSYPFLSLKQLNLPNLSFHFHILRNYFNIEFNNMSGLSALEMSLSPTHPVEHATFIVQAILFDSTFTFVLILTVISFKLNLFPSQPRLFFPFSRLFDH